MDLRRPLLTWYDAKKRDLPWRRTLDPYAIWVSEIMLQQTQVSTVIPYWLRWMERFPTIDALASADEQDVLSIWQGLGYYRRCKLLLLGARFVAEQGMPTTAAEWLKVPGVGRYTAGAIASIAFGEPAPVVDGNVQRVYARLMADDSAGKTLELKAWKWAGASVPIHRAGDWNQALMELGATICSPKRPGCAMCPISEHCKGLEAGLVEQLPGSLPSPEIVHLRQIVWIPYYDGKFGVRQIPAGQWWAGMWEFPRGSKEVDLFPEAIRVGEVKHSVTHHRITLEVFLARVNSETDSLRWCSTGDLEELALPAPQRRALRLVLASGLLPS